LAYYIQDETWSQFCRALVHVFRQRPEADPAPTLDIVGNILLGRCLDVLGGTMRIPPNLAHAIPIATLLSDFLRAVQSNETSSHLARTLEKRLAAEDQWRPLLDPLRSILAGRRDPELATGLDPGNAEIIYTLLGHLTLP